MRVLSILVLAAACGHDASQPEPGPAATGAAGVPAAAGRKPCEYMARADAETAIELKLPQTVENATLGNCDYTTPDFYGASLTVSDWSSIKAAATSSGHHPSVVAGVGDEALWGAGISVRKGDRGFLLVLNGPVVDHLPDKGLAKAKVLALTILPKL